MSHPSSPASADCNNATAAAVAVTITTRTHLTRLTLLGGRRTKARGGENRLVHNLVHSDPLTIPGNHIDNGGIKVLCKALSGCTNLTHVDLSCTWGLQFVQAPSHSTSHRTCTTLPSSTVNAIRASGAAQPGSCPQALHQDPASGCHGYMYGSITARSQATSVDVCVMRPMVLHTPPAGCGMDDEAATAIGKALASCGNLRTVALNGTTTTLVP